MTALPAIAINPVARDGAWTPKRIAHLGFRLGMGWNAKRIASDPIVASNPSSVQNKVRDLVANTGVEEIEPWRENGEEWRRLKATFPKTIAGHSGEQITYFGPDGLMRRHDYTVEVLGGATGANYSTDYKEFQGIKMPTTRRVYAYDENGQKIPDPLLVSIDIETIVFS